MSQLRFWVTSFYLALGCTGILIVAVFLTGATFGQRCAAVWNKGSPEWQDCVHKFASGTQR
jgi:hypothetical protein